MINFISKIPNNVQERNSDAWKKLCTYIDQLATSGADEFSPLEELGPELFSQIYTLPESISTLKQVKKIWLYGSKLKRIPPEIGQMTALEYFDPYTSYDLHWFPYEIMDCKLLKDSRVSTRALYGNVKNQMGFPKLDHNPVRYDSNTLHCSICKKEIDYGQTTQLWITLEVGTDTLPLLANICSASCQDKLPSPPFGYVAGPHKGGANLVQPTIDEEDLYYDDLPIIKKDTSEQSKPSDNTLNVIKWIRKIWER